MERRFQFGYISKDGRFYRRTITAPSLDDAIKIMLRDRPGCEIVSSVEV